MRDVKRAGFLLSGAVLAVYLGIVVVMAFRPHLLTGARGMAATLGFIFLSLAAMGGYSFWRIRRLHD
jgi:uncharacterized membrane protein (DUF485 family)